MNNGIYATKRCYRCGNEFNGHCSFCSVKPRKKKIEREKMWNKTVRKVERMKATEIKKTKSSSRENYKHTFSEIMKAQTYWMKNL